jgi:CBS domain-containing protein
VVDDDRLVGMVTDRDIVVRGVADGLESVRAVVYRRRAGSSGHLRNDELGKV